MKQSYDWLACPLVGRGRLTLTALLAGLLLLLSSPVGNNRGVASAAETDQGVRQCEEDYAICRQGCNGDANCLGACLQTYNACRRNGQPN